MLPTFSQSTSSLSDDTKRYIISSLPSDVRIVSTAQVRIYHSPLNGQSESWISSGMEGIVVFGRDRTTVKPDNQIGIGQGSSFEHKYWFRLIDIKASKGVVWMHQIPGDFNYCIDKPFFHTFRGKTRLFGFRFDEDAEADKFYKKVAARTNSSGPHARRQKVLPQPPVSKRLSPSMISAPTPGTFVHVAHVGYNEKGGLVASDNVEPGWTMMIEELQGYGVSPKMVADNADFVDGFLTCVRAMQISEASDKPTEQTPERKRQTLRRKPVTNFAV